MCDSVLIVKYGTLWIMNPLLLGEQVISARVPIVKCLLMVHGVQMAADISMGVNNGIDAVPYIMQQVLFNAYAINVKVTPIRYLDNLAQEKMWKLTLIR